MRYDLLRVLWICPNWPSPSLVVAYRVSQRRTLYLLEAGLRPHPVNFANRSSLRSLAGHRPRISFEASSLANRFYLISRLEQSAVAQHGMHDDRNAAGKCDAGPLSHRRLAIFVAHVFRTKVSRLQVSIELGSRLVQSEKATAAARLTADRKFLASLS